MRAGLRRGLLALAAAAAAGGVVVQQTAAEQVPPRGVHYSGQEVVPAYEGWEQNPDGSFTLVFGTMNRNWEQQLHIPVGPHNNIEPGGPDQGQPTWFQPRRNRFLFGIRVPADFGDKELVWTLTSPNGETKRAYGTLKPDYFIDNIVRMQNNGATVVRDTGRNVAPELSVEGPLERSAAVQQPVTLEAVAVDEDGLPRSNRFRLSRAGRERARTAAMAGMGGSSPPGMRLSWFVYRGNGAAVAFDPPQIKTWEDTRPNADSPWGRGFTPPPVPEDNRWAARVTFSEPGTYVLRCITSDGALTTHTDVTFEVAG